VIVGYVTRKDTSLTNARRRPGTSKSKSSRRSQQAKSHTYINKVDKKAVTPYLIKKKKNGKVISINTNKQANKGKGAKRI
jgi:hypothetical protein